MSKTLNQEEIDNLFRAAQQTQAPSAAKRRVEACDLRRSKALTSDQVRVVTTLHESFARRMANSLGAYLRVGFEMNFVSAEQLTYSDFLSRIPELTYLASVRVLPIDAHVALQADLSLVFPIVDLVLGGSGADSIDTRDLTEIEEQIFETVVTLIAHDLQETWAPIVEVDIQFEQRQQYTQVQSLMLPNEKVLSLSFEIRLPDARGTLTMAFPPVVANALLRKLSVQWSHHGRTPSRELRRRIRERLLDGRFRGELVLPPSPLTVRELLALEPGKVLTFPQHAHDPVSLTFSGKPMFLGYPVRHGMQKGARVERRLSIVGPKTKELK
jgi:flagellar motor switch protein FliM